MPARMLRPTLCGGYAQESRGDVLIRSLACGEAFSEQLRGGTRWMQTTGAQFAAAKGNGPETFRGLLARRRWQRITQAMLCRVLEQLQTWKQLIEKLEKRVT